MGEIFLIGVVVIVVLFFVNKFLDSYEEWLDGDE